MADWSGITSELVKSRFDELPTQQKQEVPTGAVKHDAGKSPVMRGCLQYFPRALKAVADISQFGYEKYKSWGGWRHVPDGLARYTDGLGRHLLNETIEGLYDPESHLLHAAHACWNSCARLEKILEDGTPMRDPNEVKPA